MMTDIVPDEEISSDETKEGKEESMEVNNDCDDTTSTTERSCATPPLPANDINAIPISRSRITTMLLEDLMNRSVMNVEIVMITIALFVLALIMLSPRGSYRGVSLKRRRRIPDLMHSSSPRTSRAMLHHEQQQPPQLPDSSAQYGGLQQQQQHEPSHGTTTTLSTNDNPTEEEESDEERFEKLWPLLNSANYSKLLLPPDCKLVDVPSARVFTLKTNKNEKQSPASKDAQDDERRNATMDDDHPLKRLQSYIQQLIMLMRQFLSYDFAGAGRVLLSWVSYCCSRRVQNDAAEEDDDDAEDSDHPETPTSTKSTKTAAAGAPSCPSPVRERKNSVSSSVYETPMGDDGEADDDASPPATIRLPKHLVAKMHTKKKDALDTYRTMSPVPFFNSSTLPLSPIDSDMGGRNAAVDTTNAEQHSVGFKFDEQDNEKQPAPERHPSESMTFFDAAHSRASLRKMHVEVPVPDRNGYILGDDFLPGGTQNTPLLVFVNSRSGPQQGQLLIGQLRRLLNPIQVWDLAQGGPERILESFCVFSRLRILVCGGDGTVSWIISCLEKMKNLEKWPPIAVLPLGTGNDLARTHGWGGGYNNESLIMILEQVAESYISLLDRWLLTTENKKGKVKETKSFFNYLGIGADAQAAIQVHMLRDSTPELFFSRLVNKMWYLLFGAEETIKQSNINLPNEITLIADGVEVPLPPDSQGIVVLNVDSFAGGIPIWSHGVQQDDPLPRTAHSFQNVQDMHALQNLVSSNLARRSKSTGMCLDSFGSEKYLARVDSGDELLPEEEDGNDKTRRVFNCNGPSSCQDGMLDIVSVRGTFHLGQIRVGLSNALRLCQAREVEIIFKSKKKVAVQTDGEPWRQGPCRMKVTRKKDPAVMLHRSPDESGGVETEMAKLLDWAEEKKVIDRNVHSVLMKEFSRRIESKTRQRRVKSQDNLMLSLKRAITSGGHNSQAVFPGTLSF